MYSAILVCLTLAIWSCNGQPTGAQSGPSWAGQSQGGGLGQLGFGGGYGGGGPMAYGVQSDPWSQGFGIQAPYMQQRALGPDAFIQGRQSPVAAPNQQQPTGQTQQQPNLPMGDMGPTPLGARSLLVVPNAAAAIIGAGPPVGQVQDGSNAMPSSLAAAGSVPPWAVAGSASGPFMGSGQTGLGSIVPPQSQHAMAVLTGSSGARGVLFFDQNQFNVTVSGSITGLSPGGHGLHVHETGDISNGCMNAGDHLNPMNRTHGGPSDAPNRHVGDLGNVQADASGTATVNIVDAMINLGYPFPAPGSIVGRAIVVHEKPDDFGKGNDAQSRQDGNTGARLACGVVVFAKRP